MANSASEPLPSFDGRVRLSSISSGNGGNYKVGFPASDGGMVVYARSSTLSGAPPSTLADLEQEAEVACMLNNCGIRAVQPSEMGTFTEPGTGLSRPAFYFPPSEVFVNGLHTRDGFFDPNPTFNPQTLANKVPAQGLEQVLDSLGRLRNQVLHQNIGLDDTQGGILCNNGKYEFGFNDNTISSHTSPIEVVTELDIYANSVRQAQAIQELQASQSIWGRLGTFTNRFGGSPPPSVSIKANLGMTAGITYGVLGLADIIHRAKLNGVNPWQQLGYDLDLAMNGGPGICGPQGC